jgi:hypothetical protein
VGRDPGNNIVLMEESPLKLSPDQPIRTVLAALGYQIQ